MRTNPFANELSITAKVAEMPRASKWLEAQCVENGVPAPQVERLLLCLDEVLANVIYHGGASALAEPVRLSFELGPEGSGRVAEVTVCDAGAAFDPLAAPLKAPAASLEEAATTGRGLEMLRQMADVLDYRREDGLNKLRFGTRLS
jgi:serine/threonine-protein kinase RsbW/sigma-B regulation protein RsbU (phosphoserine phosphatase)